MYQFINPFEKYSEKSLLIFGIIFTFFGAFLCWNYNARLAGIIDLDFGKNVTLSETIVYLISYILVLTFMLFGLAKFINKKVRLIDIVNTVLIAKIPFYCITVININGTMFKMGEQIQSSLVDNSVHSLSGFIITILIISSILMFVVLIWAFLLLYNGFKTATNLKETKFKILFVIIIIIAEIISKTFIYKFI